jgi:hypothetical protein
MTTTPQEPAPDRRTDPASTPEPIAPGEDATPPGSPVPGESAPVHDPQTPEQAAPESRTDDEDAAENPQGRVTDVERGTGSGMDG